MSTMSENFNKAITFSHAIEIPKDFTGRAYIKQDNQYRVYKNGKLHNENGPAVVCFDRSGDIVTFANWQKNGVLHNEGGPSYYLASKNHSFLALFCINGIEYTEKEYFSTIEKQSVNFESGIPNGYTGVAYVSSWGAHGIFKNSRLHNDYGPAVFFDSGTKEWWQHGSRHRLDGPAVVYADGSKQWFLNNKSFTTEAAFHEALYKMGIVPIQDRNQTNDSLDNQDNANETKAVLRNDDKIPYRVIDPKTSNQLTYITIPSTTTTSNTVTITFPTIIPNKTKEESNMTSNAKQPDMSKIKTISDWIEAVKPDENAASAGPFKTKSFVINLDGQSKRFISQLANVLFQYKSEGEIYDEETTIKMFTEALSGSGFQISVTMDEDGDACLHVPGEFDQIFEFDEEEAIEELFSITCTGTHQNTENKQSTTTKNAANKKLEENLLRFLFNRFIPDSFILEKNIDTFKEINNIKYTTEGETDFAYAFLTGEYSFALKVTDKKKFITWARNQILEQFNDGEEDEEEEEEEDENISFDADKLTFESVEKDIEKYLELTDGHIWVTLNHDTWDGSDAVMEMTVPLVMKNAYNDSLKLEQINPLLKTVNNYFVNQEKTKIGVNTLQTVFNEILNGSHPEQIREKKAIANAAKIRVEEAKHKLANAAATKKVSTPTNIKNSSTEESTWLSEELKKEFSNGMVRAGTSEFVDVLKQGLKKTLVSDLNLPGGMMTQMVINAGLDTKVGDGLLSMAVAACMPLIDKIIKEEHKQYTEVLGRELRVRSYERFVQPIIHMIREPVHDFINSKLTGQSFDLEKYKTMEYPKQVAKTLEAPVKKAVVTKKPSTVAAIENLVVQEEVVLVSSQARTS